MINAGNAGKLPTGTVINQIDQVPNDFHVDVNGDGFVTALDALRVINHINQQTLEQAESAAAEPTSNADAVDAILAAANQSTLEDDEDDFFG